MGANVVKTSNLLLVIAIRVLVMGLMKATVGPTTVLLLLLARIAAAYHLT